MRDTFHTRHFNCIQALRGFTALFVALEHVRFLCCGAFGVDIFFCISGFMAMYATHQSTEHFLRKRFIRIYPLYALATIGTFVALLIFPSLFHQTQAEISQLIKSLLFIPFEISDGIIQPLVRVGWTVNYEILFYLLFAISFRINHKYRGILCSGFLCLLVLLTNVLPDKNTILTFYGDFIQLEFILGILLYYIVRKIYTATENKVWTKWVAYSGIPILLIIFITLAITKQYVYFHGLERVIFWGLPAFLVVLMTFFMELHMKPHKSLILLGNMSFSIYLLHYYPIMLIDRAIYSLESYSPQAILVTIASLLLVIVISYISYLLIEKKFSGYLRKLIK